MINLNEMSIEKAHDSLVNKEFSVMDLAQAYLNEIEKRNGELNVYREVFSDVMEQAEKAQKLFDEGKAGMLTGIPIAIKDNILFEGHIASASSKILENHVAPYDATVIQNLKNEGVVILGRTNMDEFAMGSSTENSAYGPTKNPIDTERVPGGSSGGSSAAVASNMALVALGSDTGGSIRQPASFTGTVGFMSTYGTVSRYGLIAMASSLDVIGPITKSVRDAEVISKALMSYDKNDNTSIKIENRITKIKNTKKIGVPSDFFGDLPDEIKKNFDESLNKLENAGYKIVEIDLPILKYSLPVYYILMPAEVSSNLARFDGIRYGNRIEGNDLLETYKESRGEGFGKETRRRLMLGTYVLSHGYYDAYYNKAIKLRNAIRKDLVSAFENVDFIATPTSPFPAFKIGEKTTDPLSMYMSDLYTVPANIAGIPAISIPSGKTKDGLPLGLHLMSSYFSEDSLFTISKEFEKL